MGLRVLQPPTPTQRRWHDVTGQLRADHRDARPGRRVAASPPRSGGTAFALAVRFADNPWQALVTAATIGGDTDTIGAMIGAILGAQNGADAWPEATIARVSEVNCLDLAPLVGELVGLRRRRPTSVNDTSLT
ncbi:ADP-ribosylglycohydrolase family protein [Cutibacterium avidum]|uniref:ADP-ribosylglycohydrolase family protein n=1 Tax=Cutibacterium avidum TaxID=33010 RepID=UPI003A8F54CC